MDSLQPKCAFMDVKFDQFLRGRGGWWVVKKKVGGASRGLQQLRLMLHQIGPLSDIRDFDPSRPVPGPSNEATPARPQQRVGRQQQGAASGPRDAVDDFSRIRLVSCPLTPGGSFTSRRTPSDCHFQGNEGRGRAANQGNRCDCRGPDSSTARKWIRCAICLRHNSSSCFCWGPHQEEEQTSPGSSSCSSGRKQFEMGHVTWGLVGHWPAPGVEITGPATANSPLCSSISSEWSTRVSLANFPHWASRPIRVSHKDWTTNPPTSQSAQLGRRVTARSQQISAAQMKTWIGVDRRMRQRGPIQ